ncbi:hypothetical protein J3459_014274 [Metarhizium acridum]|nr:hypothetical protein J3459_014274 [Metarhizium acridum]
MEADIGRTASSRRTGSRSGSAVLPRAAWPGLVIVVVDCDVPWVPTLCRPKDGAAVFHVDVDPLKQLMPTLYIEAQERYRANAKTAIDQITAALRTGDAAAKLQAADGREHAGRVQAEHKQLLASIQDKAEPRPDGDLARSFGTGHLPHAQVAVSRGHHLRRRGSHKRQLRPRQHPAHLPGSWINCGGGGLGWSGGAALGIKLATEAESPPGRGKFVVQIVGDGTYLFSVPGSVYWISKRYNIPVLTIVLDNKGNHG